MAGLCLMAHDERGVLRPPGPLHVTLARTDDADKVGHFAELMPALAQRLMFPCMTALELERPAVWAAGARHDVRLALRSPGCLGEFRAEINGLFGGAGLRMDDLHITAATCGTPEAAAAEAARIEALLFAERPARVLVTGMYLDMRPRRGPPAARHAAARHAARRAARK